MPARANEPPAARRVLVIDDNRDAADAVAEALAFAGCETAVAYDGAQGLAAARAFRPDLVLCDLGLPGLDGCAVARALRADPELSQAYLVALTGWVGRADRARALAAGFDQHMAKPPDLALLERLAAGAPGPRR